MSSKIVKCEQLTSGVKCEQSTGQNHTREHYSNRCKCADIHSLYCSRYPTRIPFSWEGGVQWRVISVSEGLDNIKEVGGPGTVGKGWHRSKSICAFLSVCLWPEEHKYTGFLNLLLFFFFLTTASLTSLRRVEGPGFWLGSISLAVEDTNSERIGGIRPQASQNLFLLVSSGCHYNHIQWLAFSTDALLMMVFAAGTVVRQVDLKGEQRQIQDSLLSFISAIKWFKSA